MGSLSRALVIAFGVVGCSKTAQDPLASGPSNRAVRDAPVFEVSATHGNDRFEGTLAGYHFSIEIPHGKLASADTTAYAWTEGEGRVTLSAGPIEDETKYLVDRSPRTIVRGSDGLWVVTEVVKTAGKRAFSCLHQEPIHRDGTSEARRAAARGVATCTSLQIEPIPRDALSP